MNLVELTEFLVKQIVKEPDMVLVKQIEDEEGITILVSVDEADKGIVIGKGGNVANSIRTLVQASAYINNQKHVRVNIE